MYATILSSPSQTLPIKPHICNAKRRTKSSPSLLRLPSSPLMFTPIRSTIHYAIPSPFPYMKHGHGAFGGGTLTLEPSKLDLSQENQSELDPMLDTGGNDDDGGRGNRIGGGGNGSNGDDDDDDDEYNWRNIDPDDQSFEPWGIFRRRG